MDQKDNVSEPECSLSDSQYDMIDDLSEISTDDHDTASIASNADDAQFTFEETASEVDAEDNPRFVTDDAMHTPPSTAYSLVDLPAAASAASPRTPDQVRAQQTKAENDLIDSYMSDELETPRQSTMPMTYSTKHLLPTVDTISPDRSNTIPEEVRHDEDIYHILFVANKEVHQAHMDRICSGVTSYMQPANAGESSTHRVMRLPATPSGVTLPSTTVVCDDNGVSATVQHCIGAEMSSIRSFKLRIADADGEHSSFYTIGRASKIDLCRPDIAIFYLDSTSTTSTWLDVARTALRALSIPVLVVHDSPLGVQPPVRALRLLSTRPNARQAIVSYSDFVAMDSIARTAFLEDLFSFVKLPPPGDKYNRFGCRKSSRHNWLRLLYIFSLILPAIGFLALRNSYFGYPVLDLATRREGLTFALEKATNSTNIPKKVNMQHLLTPATAPCSSTVHVDCQTDVHLQGVAPNYIVVSFPPRPRFPQTTTTRVHKDDGRIIAFNQTKLIDGIYMVSVDPDEAYGVVAVNMITKSPDMNVTASHNFGSRILHRRTYEKAGTEASKVVSKDVAVMRHVTKSLTDRLSTELGAGAWATKNISTQLALYVTRDLQVFGNTAVSLFGKAVKATNQTASVLSRDIVLMRQDVVRYTNELSVVARSKIELAKSTSKALIRKPLAESQKRLRSLQTTWERKKDTTAVSVRADVLALEKRDSPADRTAIEKPTDQAVPMISAPDERGESQSDSVSSLKAQAQRELKRASHRLDAISRSIKKLQDKGGERLFKSEIRRHKKEAKKLQKGLSKARANLERILA